VQLLLQAVVADAQSGNRLEAAEQLLLIAIELGLEDALQLGLGLAQALPQLLNLALEVALAVRLKIPRLVGAALLQRHDLLLDRLLFALEFFFVTLHPDILLL